MNAFDTYLPWHNTGVNPDRCDFTWLFKRECEHCRTGVAVTPVTDFDDLVQGTE